MRTVVFVDREGVAFVVPVVSGGKGGSSGGGGTTTTTQTQNTEPWSEQKPFLSYGFEQAKSQFQSDKPNFFEGSTVVPYAPETEAALGAKTAMALDSGSAVNLANTETQKTLRGDYLTPGNSLYDGIMQGVYANARPSIDSAFAGSGRGTRSPGYAEALGRGIATGMTPFLSAERGRMAEATKTALPVSQYGTDLLAQVGGAREAQSRDELQEEIDRHNFEQNVDQLKLQQYMQNVTGNYGGQTTGSVTQPLYRNPLMTGLGAAASAVGIGQGLFGSPGGGGLISGMK